MYRPTQVGLAARVGDLEFESAPLDFSEPVSFFKSNLSIKKRTESGLQSAFNVLWTGYRNGM